MFEEDRFKVCGHEILWFSAKIDNRSHCTS